MAPGTRLHFVVGPSTFVLCRSRRQAVVEARALSVELRADVRASVYEVDYGSMRAVEDTQFSTGGHGTSEMHIGRPNCVGVRDVTVISGAEIMVADFADWVARPRGERYDVR